MNTRNLKHNKLETEHELFSAVTAQKGPEMERVSSKYSRAGKALAIVGGV